MPTRSGPFDLDAFTWATLQPVSVACMANAPSTTRRNPLIVFGLIAAGVVITWLFGTLLLPRWYAHRIGNFVDGRMTVGWISGTAHGIVFTVLPLLVLWAGFRYRTTWQRALAFLIGAAILAAPNLIVAGIVWGTGNAAHQGERTLDVDGPGFRGSVLVGIAIGVVLFLALLWLVLSRRSSRRKASGYRDELRQRNQVKE